MLFAGITLLLIAADQISKYAVLKYLKPISSMEIIKGVFSLTYVENRGAAFGILQNARWVFIIVTAVTILALTIYKFKTKPRGITVNTSLCLLISGAVGNLIDRIFRGYVVDMLEITFIEYPVFNVADCFVVSGALLLAVYVLFIYKEPEKELNKND